MKLAIVSTGMVTSVGFNAPASCAAIRAGISGIQDLYLTEYVGSFDQLRGGKVELPQWWDSLDRLADLVAPAIEESLSVIPEKERENVPILLGVALPDVEVLGDVITGNLLGRIEYKLGLPHHPDSSIFLLGHTSGIHALLKANELLQNGYLRYCVIAGTDSYLQNETVDAYLAHQRIITKENSNGFFPAEAGAAALVGLSQFFPEAKVQILGIGLANEPTTIISEEPFLAQGMTQAIRNMVQATGIPIHQIHTSLSDLNGEYYKFNEYNIAIARFNSRESPIQIDEMWHPIEYIGEVGAAIVPCLLNIAYFSAKKSYAPSEYILVHVGNNHTERAAMTIQIKQ